MHRARTVCNLPGQVSAGMHTSTAYAVFCRLLMGVLDNVLDQLYPLSKVAVAHVCAHVCDLGHPAVQIGKKKKIAASQASVGSMRIITGSAAGKRLVSPPGEGTRPMMEKVRGAVFNMVASMAGSQPLLPPGTRWLDLFAGTGENCGT